MSENAADGQTFEQSLQELERVVRELEDGQVGLEAALAHYEQGVRLVKHCLGQLRNAEQRILELTGSGDGNEPVLNRFEHEATAPLRAAKTKGQNAAAERLF